MKDQQEDSDAQFVGLIIGLCLNIFAWYVALADQIGHLALPFGQTALHALEYYTAALIITVLHVIARKDIDGTKLSSIDAALCWLWAPVLPLIWLARGWHLLFTKITQD